MTTQRIVDRKPVNFAGELGILNVGLGDTKLTFDKDKPVERERAAVIVADMLKRGYAIMVQVGDKDGKPLYMRAEAFDPQTCEYLIVGLSEQEEREISGAPAQIDREPKRVASSARRVTRKDASTTRAVAIARSAGG